MGIFVALLRAVNVGGTGKLAMADLRRICGEAGFADVETFIASGNVVFAFEGSAQAARDALARRLRDYALREIGVIVRRAGEIGVVLDRNPFADEEPSRTFVIFLDAAPPADAIAAATGRADERLGLGEREIYVHYPGGAGRSKLKIPSAKAGTARNLNTLRALMKMTAARGGQEDISGK